MNATHRLLRLSSLVTCICLLSGCGSDGTSANGAGATGASGGETSGGRAGTGGATGLGGDSGSGSTGGIGGGNGGAAGAANAGAGGTAGSSGAATGGAAGAAPTVPVPNKEYGSGTRLKVLVDSTPSGKSARAHSLFNGYPIFYDTKLETQCQFEKAEDGKLRCLPGYTGSTSGYSESTCSLPVASTSISCEQPKFIRDYTNSCDHSIRVFRGGSITTGPYYGRQGDLCVKYGDASPSYQTGEHVDPTEFVSAEYQAHGYGDNFGGLEIVAEDGAWARAALYDFAGKFACRPEIAMDGQWRCLPLTISVDQGYYSTASCSVSSAAGTTDSGCEYPFEDARFITERDTSTCPVRSRVIGLTAYGPAYEMSGGVCKGTLRTAYGVGAEVSPNAFRVGALAPPPSGERIAVQQIEFDVKLATKLVYSLGFRDTQHDVTCYPGPSADGALRCIPRGMYDYGWLFDSAQCSGTHVAATSETCAPRFAHRVVGQFCPTRVSTSPVLGAYSGTVYAQAGDGSCSAYPTSGTVYQLGSELSPSDLGALVQQPE